jgi:prepilin-type N-terminal cleavage/methylation domain-containing protein
MLKAMHQLRAKVSKGERGFTLVELLIVVAIIGILAAIAIPQFAAYRVRSYNASAQSDVRNMRTDLEAYYADNFFYP